MEAIRLHSPGVAGLRHETIETPLLRAGEVLVEVHAAAITRDELEWPLDRLPAVPSYELSGVVAAIGDDVADVSVGDEIYALTPFDRDGVAAEYAAVPAAILAPKPASLSHVQSAAVPLPALSAWQGLFVHGRLAAGERVLVHGAVGGVGQFATQLAHRRGAHVIATASPDAFDAARALGADEVVDGRKELDETVGRVDLVFDTVGGDLLERASALLGSGGRLVSVAEEPRGRDVLRRGTKPRAADRARAPRRQRGASRRDRLDVRALGGGRGVRAQPRLGQARQGCHPRCRRRLVLRDKRRRVKARSRSRRGGLSAGT